MKLNNSNKIIAIKNNEKIGELYDIICNKIYNYSIRYCSLSELLTKKPQKNEIKKDTPGYGGKPRKYWGYGGFIKRKISCL